jgi:hypothetical protein
MGGVGSVTCDKPISRPHESYRVCVCVCVTVSDLETSTVSWARPDLGFWATKKKNNNI